ncbi:uncharacterized protein LOC143294209 [Babylonia areolata]|uniref:uncharacterized protein LOC143294209 n=1 Tax=Babylonia areolata TaxID=304850 RepID=UPI003FD39849
MAAIAGLLTGKKPNSLNLLDSVHPDTVISTETWLDPATGDSEIFPDTYKLYCKDRNRSRGGVLIAVHTSIDSYEVNELQVDCELIWVRLKIQGRRYMYVCAYYRPDDGDEASLIQFNTSLEQAALTSSAHLLIGVYCEVVVYTQKRKQAPCSIPLYKKADWEGLRKSMTNLTNTLEEMKDTATTEELWACFRNTLHAAVKQFIPHKQVRVKVSQPWITPALHRLINRRDRVFKKMRKRGTEDLKQQHKQLRREKLISNLKPGKAPGPDNISPRILKELANELAPTLTIIFQSSVNTGTLPADWKAAHVMPVFKKGEQYNPANYRPVSLTSVCCKVLEHILTSTIMNHLEHHGILCNQQHGFRMRRFCETQLLDFNSESQKQTDILVLDFAKAFDRVNHSLLSHKLGYYGTPLHFNYCLHGHILETITSAKYLGITICSDFSWDTHINHLCNEANKTLGFLRRNIKVSSRKIKEMAYKSFVRPILEYASSIWDPHTEQNISKFEAVQCRAARFVMRRYHNTSSPTAMLEELKWSILQDRRRTARLSMLYKIHNNLVSTEGIKASLRPAPPRRRRGHDQQFAIPQCRTVKGLPSPLKATPRVFFTVSGG